mgnify:CR=1 FL=1
MTRLLRYWVNFHYEISVSWSFKHLAMLDQNIQNKHNTRLIQEIFQNKKENKKIGGCKHQRKGGNEVWISDKCTFTPEIIGRK